MLARFVLQQGCCIAGTPPTRVGLVEFDRSRAIGLNPVQAYCRTVKRFVAVITLKTSLSLPVCGTRLPTRNGPRGPPCKARYPPACLWAPRGLHEVVTWQGCVCPRRRRPYFQPPSSRAPEKPLSDLRAALVCVLSSSSSCAIFVQALSKICTLPP
jgi:hypothetical protein